MSGLFRALDEAQVIVRRRGVFKQLRLYTRSGQIYAGVGKDSFIRLLASGSTTQPDTIWDTLYDPRKEVEAIAAKPPRLQLMLEAA